MKAFFGLGNPGEEYQDNRHNVGFMLVEFLKSKSNKSSNYRMDTKLASELADAYFGEEKYLIVEPQTYMNASGEAVSKVMQYFKVDIQDIFVAHDDLDIPLGKFKIQIGTGPKLHGGLTSIEQLLRTKDFMRIRIGVDNRPTDIKIPGETYVLQDFTKLEKETLLTCFENIYTQLKLLKILV